MNLDPQSFNHNNNHQLIPRQQNYVLHRKLLTVHSGDRDINKWPAANLFEITLPESIQNVQSMRLIQTALPSRFCNISESLQNNKMFVNDKTIIVTDGFYTPEHLAFVITSEASGDFRVEFDSVKQKFMFFNIAELDFTQHCKYESCKTHKPEVWCQYTKWGLGSYLGFDKKIYTKTEGSIFIEAPHFPKLDGEQVIYMEVDKYNSYDELTPYSESTNNLYKNDYSAKVNSAFAKIPLTKAPSKGNTAQVSIFDSRNMHLQNISYFDPPIERIHKLKFKFRYHNGILVDFKDQPFTFTIEFNCLHNEIHKTMNVVVPGLLTL